MRCVISLGCVSSRVFVGVGACVCVHLCARVCVCVCTHVRVCANLLDAITVLPVKLVCLAKGSNYGCRA